MNSGQEIHDLDNDIRAIELALEERRVLREKLLMIQTLTRDIVEMTMNNMLGSASGGAFSTIPSAGRSSSQPSHSYPSQSSDQYQTNSTGSTMAHCRILLPGSDTGAESGSRTSSPWSQENSSQRSNRSSCCEDRLTEITFRVLRRGYDHADPSWLYEMQSLLRTIIQDRQNRSNSLEQRSRT